MSALLGELARDRSAQAAARAGDEDSGSLEIHCLS
jgi:hypothetical protein